MDRSLESGFSIIEIFIVIIIISTSAVIFTRSLKSSVGLQKDAYTSELAFKAAESKLIQLSAAPFPVDSSDQIVEDNLTLFRIWEIDTVGPIKRASITVQWSRAENRRRQINLTGALR